MPRGLLRGRILRIFIRNTHQRNFFYRRFPTSRHGIQCRINNVYHPLRDPMIFAACGNAHHNFSRIKIRKIFTGDKPLRTIRTPHAAMKPYNHWGLRRIFVVYGFPLRLSPDFYWPPDSRRTLERQSPRRPPNINHQRIRRGKRICDTKTPQQNKNVSSFRILNRNRRYHGFRLMHNPDNDKNKTKDQHHDDSAHAHEAPVKLVIHRKFFPAKFPIRRSH